MNDEPAATTVNLAERKRAERAAKREARQQELADSRAAKHADWMLGEHDPLQNSEKQKEWDKHKTAQRAERAESRAIPVPMPPAPGTPGIRCKHQEPDGGCSRRRCRCALARRRAIIRTGAR